MPISPVLQAPTLSVVAEKKQVNKVEAESTIQQFTYRDLLLSYPTLKVFKKPSKKQSGEQTGLYTVDYTDEVGNTIKGEVTLSYSILIIPKVTPRKEGEEVIPQKVRKRSENLEEDSVYVIYDSLGKGGQGSVKHALLLTKEDLESQILSDEKAFRTKIEAVEKDDAAHPEREPRICAVKSIVTETRKVRGAQGLLENATKIDQMLYGNHLPERKGEDGGMVEVDTYDRQGHEKKVRGIFSLAVGKQMANYLGVGDSSKDGGPVSRSALSFEERMSLLRYTLMEVDRAHQLGIAHRDLKPENLIIGIDPGGKLLGVRLIDFDISVIRPETEEDDKFFFDRSGTEGYIAPEATKFGDTNFAGYQRADIYAVGRIMLDIFGINPPESGQLNVQSFNEQFEKALGKDPVLNQSTQDEKDKLRDKLYALYDGLTKVNPAERMTLAEAKEKSEEINRAVALASKNLDSRASASPSQMQAPVPPSLSQLVPQPLVSVIRPQQPQPDQTVASQHPASRNVLLAKVQTWFDITDGKSGRLGRAFGFSRPSIFKDTGLDSKIRTLEKAFANGNEEIISRAVLDLKCCMNDVARQITDESIELDENRLGRKDAFDTLKVAVDAVAEDVKRPVALLDVDDTILPSGSYDISKPMAEQLNWNLLNALKGQEVKDFYLFTDMNFRSGELEERQELVKILENQGFIVHGVITPCDMFYQFLFVTQKLTPEAIQTKLIGLAEKLREKKINLKNPGSKDKEDFDALVEGFFPGWKEASKVEAPKLGKIGEGFVGFSKNPNLPTDPIARTMFRGLGEFFASTLGYVHLKGELFSMFLQQKPEFVSSCLVFDDKVEPLEAVQKSAKDSGGVIPVSTIKVDMSGPKKLNPNKRPDTQEYYERQIAAHQLRAQMQRSQSQNPQQSQSTVPMAAPVPASTSASVSQPLAMSESLEQQPTSTSPNLGQRSQVEGNVGQVEAGSEPQTGSGLPKATSVSVPVTAPLQPLQPVAVGTPPAEVKTSVEETPDARPATKRSSLGAQQQSDRQSQALERSQQASQSQQVSPAIPQAKNEYQLAAESFNFSAMIGHAMKVGNMGKEEKDNFRSVYGKMIGNVAAIMKEEMVRFYRAVPEGEWLNVKAYSSPEEARRAVPNKQTLTDYVNKLGEWVKLTILAETTEVGRVYMMVSMIELAQYALNVLHDSASYAAIMSVLVEANEKVEGEQSERLSPLVPIRKLLPKEYSEQLERGSTFALGRYAELRAFDRYDDFVLSPAATNLDLTFAIEGNDGIKRLSDGSVAMQADGKVYHPNLDMARSQLVQKLPKDDCKSGLEGDVKSKFLSQVYSVSRGSVSETPILQTLKLADKDTGIEILSCNIHTDKVSSIAGKSIQDKYLANIENPILAKIVKQCFVDDKLEIKLIPLSGGDAQEKNPPKSVEEVITKINQILSEGKVDDAVFAKVELLLAQINIKLDISSDVVISLLNGDAHRKFYTYADENGKPSDPDFARQMKLFEEKTGTSGFMDRLAKYSNFVKNRDEFLGHSEEKINYLERYLSEVEKLLGALEKITDSRVVEMVEKIRADLDEIVKGGLIEKAKTGIELLQNRIRKIDAKAILAADFKELVNNYNLIVEKLAANEKDDVSGLLEIAVELQTANYELIPSVFTRLEGLGIEVERPGQDYMNKYKTMLDEVVKKLNLLEGKEQEQEKISKIKGVKEGLQKKLNIISCVEELRDTCLQIKQLLSEINLLRKDNQAIPDDMYSSLGQLEKKFNDKSQEVLDFNGSCEHEKEDAKKDPVNGYKRGVLAELNQNIIGGVLKVRAETVALLRSEKIWQRIVSSTALVDKKLIEIRKDFLNNPSAKSYLRKLDELFENSEGFRMLSEIAKDKDRYAAYCELLGEGRGENPLFKLIGSNWDKVTGEAIAYNFNILSLIEERNPGIGKVILDRMMSKNVRFKKMEDTARDDNINKFSEAVRESSPFKEIGGVLGTMIPVGGNGDEWGHAVKQAALHAMLPPVFQILLKGVTLRHQGKTGKAQKIIADSGFGNGEGKKQYITEDDKAAAIKLLKEIVSEEELGKLYNRFKSTDQPAYANLPDKDLAIQHLADRLIKMSGWLKTFNELKKEFRTNPEKYRTTSAQVKTLLENLSVDSDKSLLGDLLREVESFDNEIGGVWKRVMEGGKSISDVEEMLKKGALKDVQDIDIGRLEVNVGSLEQIYGKGKVLLSDGRDARNLLEEIKVLQQAINFLDKTEKGQRITLDAKEIEEQIKVLQKFIDNPNTNKIIFSLSLLAKERLSQQAKIAQAEKFFEEAQNKYTKCSVTSADIQTMEGHITFLKKYRSVGEVEKGRVELLPKMEVLLEEMKAMLGTQAGYENLVGAGRIVEEARQKERLAGKAIAEFYTTEQDFWTQLATFITAYDKAKKEFLNGHKPPEFVVAFDILIEPLRNLLKAGSAFMSPADFSSLSLQEKITYLSKQLDIGNKEQLDSLFKLFEKDACISDQRAAFVSTLTLGKSEHGGKAFIDCINEQLASLGDATGVSSALMRPFQRACKYPLLFRDLANYFPENSAEKVAFNVGQTAIDRLVRQVNAGMKRYSYDMWLEIVEDKNVAQALCDANIKLPLGDDGQVIKDTQKLEEIKKIFCHDIHVLPVDAKAAKEVLDKVFGRLQKCSPSSYGYTTVDRVFDEVLKQPQMLIYEIRKYLKMFEREKLISDSASKSFDSQINLLEEMLLAPVADADQRNKVIESQLKTLYDGVLSIINKIIIAEKKHKSVAGELSESSSGRVTQGIPGIAVSSLTNKDKANFYALKDDIERLAKIYKVTLPVSTIDIIVETIRKDLKVFEGARDLSPTVRQTKLFFDTQFAELLKQLSNGVIGYEKFLEQLKVQLDEIHKTIYAPMSPQDLEVYKASVDVLKQDLENFEKVVTEKLLKAAGTPVKAQDESSAVVQQGESAVSASSVPGQVQEPKQSAQKKLSATLKTLIKSFNEVAAKLEGADSKTIMEIADKLLAGGYELIPSLLAGLDNLKIPKSTDVQNFDMRRCGNMFDAVSRLVTLEGNEQKREELARKGQHLQRKANIVWYGIELREIRTELLKIDDSKKFGDAELSRGIVTQPEELRQRFAYISANLEVIQHENEEEIARTQLPDRLLLELEQKAIKDLTELTSTIGETLAKAQTKAQRWAAIASSREERKTVSVGAPTAEQVIPAGETSELVATVVSSSQVPQVPAGVTSAEGQYVEKSPQQKEIDSLLTEARQKFLDNYLVKPNSVYSKDYLKKLNKLFETPEGLRKLSEILKDANRYEAYCELYLGGLPSMLVGDNPLFRLLGISKLGAAVSPVSQERRDEIARYFDLLAKIESKETRQIILDNNLHFGKDCDVDKIKAFNLYMKSPKSSEEVHSRLRELLVDLPDSVGGKDIEQAQLHLLLPPVFQILLHGVTLKAGWLAGKTQNVIERSDFGNKGGRQQEITDTNVGQAVAFLRKIVSDKDLYNTFMDKDAPRYEDLSGKDRDDRFGDILKGLQSKFRLVDDVLQSCKAAQMAIAEVGNEVDKNATIANIKKHIEALSGLLEKLRGNFNVVGDIHSLIDMMEELVERLRKLLLVESVVASQGQTPVPVFTVSMSREALRNSKHIFFDISEELAPDILPLSRLARCGLEYEFFLGDVRKPQGDVSLVFPSTNEEESADGMRIYRRNDTKQNLKVCDIADPGFLQQVMRELLSAPLETKGLAGLATAAKLPQDIISEISAIEGGQYKNEGEKYLNLSQCLSNAQPPLTVAQIRAFGMLCMAIHQSEVPGCVLTPIMSNSSISGMTPELATTGSRHLTITATEKGFKIEFIQDVEGFKFASSDELIRSAQYGVPVMRIGGTLDFEFPSDEDQAIATLADVSSTVEVYSDEVFKNQDSGNAFINLLREKITNKPIRQWEDIELQITRQMLERKPADKQLEGKLAENTKIILKIIKKEQGRRSVEKFTGNAPVEAGAVILEKIDAKPMIEWTIEELGAAYLQLTEAYAVLNAVSGDSVNKGVAQLLNIEIEVALLTIQTESLLKKQALLLQDLDVTNFVRGNIAKKDIGKSYKEWINLKQKEIEQYAAELKSLRAQIAKLPTDSRTNLLRQSVSRALVQQSALQGAQGMIIRDLRSTGDVESRVAVELLKRFNSYADAARIVLLDNIDSAAIKAMEDVLNLQKELAKHPEFISNEKGFQNYLFELVGIVTQCTGQTSKAVLADLNIAEGLYSAMRLGSQSLCTVTSSTEGKVLIQKDIPVSSRYTEMQVMEYLSILDNPGPPQWFRDLPLFAQKYLQIKLASVKEAFVDGGIELARRELGRVIGVLPTTLRKLPGTANYMLHTATILDAEGTVVLETQNVRASTLSPIGMKNKQDQLKGATDNLGQVVMTHYVMLVRKLKAKGLRDDQIIEQLKQSPILVQSLVTPMAGPFDFMKEGEMVAVKEAAIRSLQQIKIKVGGKEVEIKPIFISTNHPLNKYRKGLLLDIVRKNKDEENLEAARVLLIKTCNFLTSRYPDHVQEFLSGYEDKPLQEFASLEGLIGLLLQPSLSALGDDDSVLLLHALKVYSNLMTGGRHKDVERDENLFRSALELIIVDKIDGLGVSGCKSGKDRRGVEGIYVDAMEEYYAEYKKFPSPDDRDIDRQNFVNIVVKLFKAGHAQELASLNSFGVRGLKALKGVLPEDVLKELGPEFLEENKVLSAQNKPKLPESPGILSRLRAGLSQRLRKGERKQKEVEIQDLSKRIVMKAEETKEQEALVIQQVLPPAQTVAESSSGASPLSLPPLPKVVEEDREGKQAVIVEMRRRVEAAKPIAEEKDLQVVNDGANDVLLEPTVVELVFNSPKNRKDSGSSLSALQSQALAINKIVSEIGASQTRTTVDKSALKELIAQLGYAEESRAPEFFTQMLAEPAHSRKAVRGPETTGNKFNTTVRIFTGLVMGSAAVVAMIAGFGIPIIVSALAAGAILASGGNNAARLEATRAQLMRASDEQLRKFISDNKEAIAQVKGPTNFLQGIGFDKTQFKAEKYEAFEAKFIKSYELIEYTQKSIPLNPVQIEMHDILIKIREFPAMSKFVEDYRNEINKKETASNFLRSIDVDPQSSDEKIGRVVRMFDRVYTKKLEQGIDPLQLPEIPKSRGMSPESGA